MTVRAFPQRRSLPQRLGKMSDDEDEYIYSDDEQNGDEREPSPVKAKKADAARCVPNRCTLAAPFARRRCGACSPLSPFSR